MNLNTYSYILFDPLLYQRLRKKYLCSFSAMPRIQVELIKSGWIINYMEINQNCKCDAVRLKTMNPPTHFISYYLLPTYSPKIISLVLNILVMKLNYSYLRFTYLSDNRMNSNSSVHSYLQNLHNSSYDATHSGYELCKASHNFE